LYLLKPAVIKFLNYIKKQICIISLRKQQLIQTFTPRNKGHLGYKILFKIVYFLAVKFRVGVGKNRTIKLIYVKNISQHK